MLQSVTQCLLVHDILIVGVLSCALWGHKRPPSAVLQTANIDQLKASVGPESVSSLAGSSAQGPPPHRCHQVQSGRRAGLRSHQTARLTEDSWQAPARCCWQEASPHGVLGSEIRQKLPPSPLLCPGSTEPLLCVPSVSCFDTIMDFSIGI